MRREDRLVHKKQILENSQKDLKKKRGESEDGENPDQVKEERGEKHHNHQKGKRHHHQQRTVDRAPIEEQMR